MQGQDWEKDNRHAEARRSRSVFTIAIDLFEIHILCIFGIHVEKNMNSIREGKKFRLRVRSRARFVGGN